MAKASVNSTADSTTDDEDDSDEEYLSEEGSSEDERDSFDSDLNASESLTECEFTDSEGRPNPFHKHMEVPKIVIQAGSPAIGHFDRVAPPGQRIYPTSDTDDDDAEMMSATGFQTGTNFNDRFQYKTPNLSGRLKSEQIKEEKAKVSF